MFLIEVRTREGRVSEVFATYEEAVERVDKIPLEDLLGTPFIFERLPDGSERVIRGDQKPLQIHRIEDPIEEEEPIQLAESPMEHGENVPWSEIVRPIPRWRDEEEEEPLPILEGPVDEPLSPEDTASK